MSNTRTNSTAMTNVKLNCILILTAVTVTCCQNPLLLTSGDPNKYVAKCVLKLSAKYFVSKKAMSGSIVIININSYNSKSQKILLKTIHKGMKYSVMVKDSAYKHKNASHFPEKAQNYMMLLEDKDELLKNINQLRKLPTWNPHAKTAVYIALKPDHNLDSLVKEIIDTLRDFKLLQTIVFIDFPQNEEVKSYTWKPYSVTNCGGKCDQFYTLDICKSDQLIEVHRISDLIPQNMHSCPLKVYSVISEPYVLPPKRKIENTQYDDEYEFKYGIEINILKIIAEFSNLSLIIRMSNESEDWGYLLDNGTATSLYAKLRSEEVDVIVGDLEVNHHIRKWFDSSHTYIQDYYTWCVPKAGPASTWSNLITIFKLSTWITTFAAILLIGTILHWFKRQENPKYTKWPTRSILMTVGMVLGWGALFNPKGTAFRILLLSWLLFSININTSYQSFLRSFLIHPKYEKQIGSQAEIVRAAFDVGGKESTKYHFQEDTDPISKYLYSHYQVCESFKDFLTRVGIEKDFAVAAPRRQAIYHAQRVGKGEALVYCFPEKDMIYKYSIAILARKWFPILNRFNGIIRSVTENGLIWKWNSEVYLDTISLSDTNEIVPLGMTHMLGAFLMILISHSICFTVFICEIIFFSIHKRFKKNKGNTK